MISRRAAEIATALVTGAFGIVTAIGATEFGTGWSTSGPEPGAFPFYVGLMIALASAGNLLTALLANNVRLGRDFVSGEQLWLVLGFALPMAAFVVSSLFLGLYVGTALYMFGTLYFQSGYSAWRSSLIAIGLPVFFYLVIERGFQVSMLKGPLEAALGL